MPLPSGSQGVWMDASFTLFVVAMLVFAFAAICFPKWRSSIATVMAIVVTLSIGAIMVVHAQDRELKPLPLVIYSRPAN